MTANLWRALERLGSTGNAACDWRMHLADDWDAARGFLRESPDQADTVIDPDGTGERLAVHQEWHNPPSEAPDHEKIRQQFRRLENLLMDLVPLPERPFRRTRGGGFAPVFGIVLHEDFGGGAEVRR